LNIAKFLAFYGSKLYTLIVYCMEKKFLFLPVLEKTFLVNVFAKLEEGKAVCVGELLKDWEG